MKMRLKAPQIVKFSAARAWTGAVTWRGIESSKCLNYDGAASSKTDPLASHPPVGPGRPWRSPQSNPHAEIMSLNRTHDSDLSSPTHPRSSPTRPIGAPFSPACPIGSKRRWQCRRE